MLLREMLPRLRQHFLHMIRLHCQHQHIRKLQHFGIRRRRLRPHIFRETLPGTLDRIARQQISRARQAGIHETLRQRRRHLARAQKPNPQLGSHARTLTPRFSPVQNSNSVRNMN